MAFDVKELMIDITKAKATQFNVCQLGCTFQISWCHCTVQGTFCYHFTLPTCFTGTIVPCNLGTYTCIGTIVTCGGTIYCAGSNDPTILYQSIDKETIAQAKAQLQSALKEIEAQEKRLG